ncbi:MAG: hypothetical protein AAF405_10540 [Pseudomonadota bacterium]
MMYGTQCDQARFNSMMIALLFAGSLIAAFLVSGFFDSMSS